MPALTQTILDAIADVTKDVDRQRWTLAEISRWLNQTASVIARLDARSTSDYYPLTLAAGVRQDLRTIDNTKSWISLQELVCNASPTGEATGDSILKVPRSALDSAFRTWRGGAPTATKVKEYAVNDIIPFVFDVNPPVAAGTKVIAIARVNPAPFCVLNAEGTALANAAEEIPLADGFEVPLLDGTLVRMFSKDANDPTYAARVTSYLQMFQLAMGVEGKATTKQ